MKTTISLSNMNLFDKKEKLKSFKTINNIIDDYYHCRLEYYDKRRTYQIETLHKECEILKNKWTYIQEILNNTIDLRKKKLVEINNLLETKKYIQVDDSYNYLIKMTMDSVSEEAIDNLKNKYEEKQRQLELLLNTTIQQLWINDLDELKEILKF